VAWVNDAQVVAVTLWIVHTYIYEQADQTPYLAITSPEKRSGKSRVLDVLEKLVAKPWSIVQPSEAVLFRKIAKDGPTLLLDEVDTIFSPRAPGQEAIRAHFNAGNRAGITVPRCVGDDADLRVEDFRVYVAGTTR
jgi:hypothetical protein